MDRMKTKGWSVALASGILVAIVFALAAWLSLPHIRFYLLFAPLGRNEQGFREYRHRKTGIVFVRLPGGKFWMGAQKKNRNKSNYDPGAEDDEGPVHQVTLTPFLITKFEVTQGQWQAAMGSNPARFKGEEDRPVEQVSWDDINGFNAKTGFRLTQEAEWEYACRGGSRAPIAGNGMLDEMG